jgi:hypothetical protein
MGVGRLEVGDGADEWVPSVREREGERRERGARGFGPRGPEVDGPAGLGWVR